MSKEIKNKIVPKLRFPEFKNDGGWKETKLSAIADLLNEKAGTKPYTLMSVTSGVGLISQKEKFGREIAGAQYKNYYVIKKYDFAYNKSATKLYPEGYIAMLKEFETGAVPNSIFTCFRIKDKKAIPEFLDFIFYNNLHGKWLRKFIEIGARAHGSLSVDNNVLFSMPLELPSLEEQQKIALCLSSLDDLITTQSQKLEALKEHKKGLMQQLFPAEGETVPKLRFQEFKDSGEWQEKELGEVTSYFKGFAFESKNYTSSGIRIIRVSDMDFDYIKKENKAIYINEENADKYDRWKLKELDLIVTTVGSKPPVYDSLVGRTIVVQSKDEGSLLNQNAVCLRANKNVEQSFLNALFKRDGYINFIESIIRGNANQGSITLENLFQFKLLVPSSKEQQKIASCLYSLDEYITAQTEKIELLKVHKKGLMQGLFPS
jgi:type I restriction enzyme S subunit